MQQRRNAPVRGRRKPAISLALRSCRRALTNAFLLSMCINVLLLAGSLYMLQVYDRVLASRSVPTLVALTLLLFIMLAFMVVYEVVRARIMSRVGARLDELLRGRAFDAVIDGAVARQTAVGTLPVKDLETVRHFVAGPAMFALFDLPWAPLYILLCFLFHPLVGAYAALSTVLLMVLARLNEMLTRRTMDEATPIAQAAQAMTDEGRRSAEVLRAMAMSGHYRDRWSRRFDVAQLLMMKAADRANLISSIMKGLRLFLQSAILGVGAYLVIHNEISAGVMIACSILLARAVSPIELVIGHWRSILQARQSYDRLRNSLVDDADKDEQQRLPTPRGQVSVESLAVAAPGGDRLLLRGINFTLEPGHGLGVIGPTGSGKSTLARALVGVWPVYAGTVRLDGFTIDQWPAEQIGQAIGYLPQDVELFDGTVRDNIARFEPEPDHDKVLAAAQAAHVHELIGQFPRGYDTPLGEGGQRLSAGQRQRIGLARALYGQPKLIVLDEPNANLDSAGETALVRALLDARRRGATVVVVAHHASALNAVDLVLYLNEGQQRELGPKRQVLEKLLRTTRSAAPTPVHPSVRPQSAQAGTAIAKPAGNPSDESSGAN